MGKILWPGDKWRCSFHALKDYLPGKDRNHMVQMIEYGQQIQEAFDLEDEGERLRNHRGTVLHGQG